MSFSKKIVKVLSGSTAKTNDRVLKRVDSMHNGSLICFNTLHPLSWDGTRTFADGEEMKNLARENAQRVISGNTITVQSPSLTDLDLTYVGFASHDDSTMSYTSGGGIRTTGDATVSAGSIQFYGKSNVYNRYLADNEQDFAIELIFRLPAQSALPLGLFDWESHTELILNGASNSLKMRFMNGEESAVSFTPSAALRQVVMGRYQGATYFYIDGAQVGTVANGTWNIDPVEPADYSAWRFPQNIDDTETYTLYSGHMWLPNLDITGRTLSQQVADSYAHTVTNDAYGFVATP